MKPAADVTALVVGLIGLLIAALGLWTAFGTVTWTLVAAGTPFLLVACGLIGLFASRSTP